VLDRGEIDGWFGSTTIVACAATAACALILFLPWELIRSDPVVEVRLLFQRQFGLAFIVMLAVGGILFGSNQITPQLMQTSFAYTAELSGLAMMPGGLAMMIMMPIAGQITGLMQPKYWMAVGFGIVAAAMWYSTTLTPDATFGFFATIRIFQTFGLPLLFLPVNMIAYSELPPDATNQGSALVNVARNLGGSVGVSLANTELLRRSQFHQARLVSNLFPTSLAYKSTMAHLTQYFSQVGSPASAHGRAIDYVGTLVASQATLLAYIDIFYAWALFAAILVPVVLLLVHRTSSGTARSTAMH
jgi:DHA2 family multidrug resistance protein